MNRLSLGLTASFLVPISQGYLLVDTCTKKSKAKLESAFTTLQIDPLQIAYILITHHHSDHIGLVNYLRSQHPQIRLIGHQSSVPYLEKGTMAPTACVNRRVNLLFSLSRKNGQEPVVLHSDDIFLEGDDDRLLPSMGLDAKILHTPGHTEDSISVLFPNGNCLVGDTVMHWPLNFLGANPFPILIQDHIALKASWAKIEASGAKRLFPSHGKPIDVESLASSITQK